jgi:hypothetical protein
VCNYQFEEEKKKEKERKKSLSSCKTIAGLSSKATVNQRLNQTQGKEKSKHTSPSIYLRYTFDKLVSP